MKRFSVCGSVTQAYGFQDIIILGLDGLDQYLWPYLKSDLERGIISIEEAEELLAEFFISLNKG